MRPFLKWAGGKARLVPRIASKLPPGRRLVEPFAGSCAVSLNTQFDNYWLNDVNPDLIMLYQMIQAEGTAFIAHCRSYFIEKNNSEKQYYTLRNQFNREKNPQEKSALFLYLNRHGYNGLSRYNASGEFNVPFGRYKKPYFPEAELNHFAEHFQHAVFTCLDFEEVMLSATPDDVIYCDPPYVPLNETSNFTAYSAGGFGLSEQKRLAETAETIAERGIITVISNHANNFILELYQNAAITIETFPVQRFISCVGNNRNTVDEVLAVFGKKEAD